MGKGTALRIGQWTLAIAVVALAVRSIIRNWTRLHEQPVVWQISPLLITASLLVTWMMYALLIQAWRVMLGGWGQPIAARAAARIWTVSSLGKYLPGQIWAIAGMAMMAQRAGIAPWAAGASSVLLQGLAVGTGACIVGLTGSALLTAYPSARIVLAVLAVASVLGVVLLTWPPFVRRVLGALRVRIVGAESPGASAIVFGAAANAAAWAGYGLALWLLARGTLDAPGVTLLRATGAFTGAYLAGFLAFGVPDGLIVRETVFVSLMQGAVGAPTALALALVSRVVLTVAQLGAAAPFLLSSPERMRAQP